MSGPRHDGRGQSDQQLLQAALPERLVGAHGDAVTPPKDLLNRDRMTSPRFSHLNLHFRPRCDRFGPRALLQALRHPWPRLRTPIPR